MGSECEGGDARGVVGVGKGRWRGATACRHQQLSLILVPQHEIKRSSNACRLADSSPPCTIAVPDHLLEQ